MFRNGALGSVASGVCPGRAVCFCWQKRCCDPHDQRKHLAETFAINQLITLGLPAAGTCRQRISHAKVHDTDADLDSHKTQSNRKTPENSSGQNDCGTYLKLDTHSGSQERTQNLKGCTLGTPAQQQQGKRMIPSQSADSCGHSFQRAFLQARRWMGQWSKDWVPAIMTAKKVKIQ